MAHLKAELNYELHNAISAASHSITKLDIYAEEKPIEVFSGEYILDNFTISGEWFRRREKALQRIRNSSLPGYEDVTVNNSIDNMEGYYLSVGYNF